MSELPPTVLRHVQSVALRARRAAYLFVSSEGTVGEIGGDLSTYGLEGCHRGQALVGPLDFLDALLPLHGQPAEVPFVSFAGSRYADVHLVPGHGGDWVLLLDATKDARRDQIIQQRAHELSLLRDRLAEQNAALRVRERIIASAVNPIATTDLAGRLTYVNAAFLRLWGFDRQAGVLGKPSAQFWEPHPASLSGPADAGAPGGWIGRVRGWRPDGTPLDLQLCVTRVEDERGRALCLSYSFVDITELRRLRRTLHRRHGVGGIVGQTPEMLRLFDTIREVADVTAPVLLQGESGTGKELVASAIHCEGPRADKPFIAVNCGALPEGVLESELFGHVRGAFTGAVRDRKGRFELADGGTLFLDEVAELPAAVQVKLLRVLQDGSFQRVGAEQTSRADVRVISATNRDLRGEVAAERFREDLFYRLAVVPIALPPLRTRTDDIPLLVEHVLRGAAEEGGRAGVGVADETIAALQAYAWPGNIRELENALQYALVKCGEGVLRPDHLPASVLSGPAPAPLPPARKRRRRKLTADAVRRALSETNNNRAAAARRLSVSRATLYRFLADAAPDACT